MLKNNKTLRYKLYTAGQVLAIIIFIVSAIVLINEMFIQPYKSNKVIQTTQSLYHSIQNDMVTGNPLENSLNASNTKEIIPYQDPERDSKGRLLRFADLLAINEDVKGWISIADTNINYPVMQSSINDPEYYLTRNINKTDDKCGSIFLDKNSSVEKNSKNLVLHGHNMTSTDNMFHYLLEYKKLNYYKSHPIISFDTIYKTGEWKVISIFKTTASTDTEEFFNYLQSTFEDSSDFLNFVYQLRIRSIIECPVDLNENDQLLTLSTCSYELDNYRTVIIARRIREGEVATVDTQAAIKNANPLYSSSWYDLYGGTAPEVTTFENAIKKGTITWYTH